MAQRRVGATPRLQFDLSFSSHLNSPYIFHCIFTQIFLMTILGKLIVGSIWCTLSQRFGSARASGTRPAWIRLVIACACLTGLWQAQALAGDLPLPRLISRVALEPHTAWLRDTQGQLTVEEVSSPALADQFIPLQGPLSLGFTRSVVWIRLDLRSAESAQWLLDVGNPILEDVRLYARGDNGIWTVRHGTLSGNGDMRDMNYRKPVFKINLKTGDHSIFYLRLASRTAMVTNLQLSAPEFLFEKDTRESFVWGLVYGAYLLVMIFYTAFWIWTREKVHLHYTMYVGINLGSAFLTGHWTNMLGLNLESGIHTLVLGIFICLSLWIAPVFSASYLKTYRIWPRSTRWFLRICASISTVCVGMVLAGLYGQGVMSIQIASMFLIVATIAVSGHLALKGDKRAQLLLLAFGLFYIGVLWRYMRNIGLIEPSWWNENVYQIGAFIHMMVMSTGIFSSYNALRQKSEQDRARANAQEIQRQRQYEFLGMVSHEVRTPLTVITASADNLLLDPTVSPSTRIRVEKIIRHCGKLQHLFDSYLDNERLLNGDKPFTMAAVDLTSLCESTVQDVGEAHGIHVGFQTDLLPNVVCNSDLVKVAITNLLENARKHSTDTSGIHLQLRRSDSFVSICVTDKGEGVDDKDLPYIFDAYYRGKGAYASKGSGLGLHLVKFIAEQHKGRVYAVKLETQGMRFVLEIPIHPTPSGI